MIFHPWPQVFVCTHVCVYIHICVYICMHILKLRLYSLQSISLTVKVEAMGREMRFFRNVSFQMENVLPLLLNKEAVHLLIAVFVWAADHAQSVPFQSLWCLPLSSHKFCLLVFSDFSSVDHVIFGLNCMNWNTPTRPIFKSKLTLPSFIPSWDLVSRSLSCHWTDNDLELLALLPWGPCFLGWQMYVTVS